MDKETLERAESLAFAAIKKQYGSGAIFKLDDGPIPEVEVISTGNLKLDLALGIGGFPRGRIIEIIGPESSGKTTSCLQAIASVQKIGGLAAFVDAENALDLGYAEKLGVNIKDLAVAQPSCGEEALNIVEMLTRSGAYSIIVIDSIAALVPKAEIEGEMGDSFMGLQARMMGQAMRKLTSITSSTKTILLFTNQIRMKIGVMFGSPETSPGGNAIKFFASIRLDIRKNTKIKVGEEITGFETTIKVIKNKLAPPFRQCTCNMIFGEGLEPDAIMFDLGIDAGLIDKSGNTFSYNGERLAVGRPNALAAFKLLSDEIKTKLREEILRAGKPVSITDTTKDLDGNSDL